MLIGHQRGNTALSDSIKRPRDVVLVGRGIQPSHVRQTNQRAILSVISLQPGISNAELARVTDLAPQTVSAVLTDLEQLNLVTRGEVLRGRRGQPATPLYMNPVGPFDRGGDRLAPHRGVSRRHRDAGVEPRAAHLRLS